MPTRIQQLFCVMMATALVTLASSSNASAQYPVVVNTTTPAVVGYTAEPTGLFGFRTKYRPIVAPVATPVAVVKPVSVVPPPAPVVRYTAPVVQTYYAPAPVITPAPVVAPVTYVRY